MKLPPGQTNEASLLRFGREAISLLEKRDFQSLAERFDYALTFDRKPVVAIEEDFQRCLTEFRASCPRRAAAPSSMVVKYFQPNDANLFAVVEGTFTTAEGCPVFVELIVTSSGDDRHICLEEISLAAD